MRLEISYKNMGKNEVLESTIGKNMEKIKRRIKLFKRDAPVHVSVHLEKNPHKEQYLSWITMYMPYKVLKAHRSNVNTCTSINDSFSAIVKQLDKFKYKLENHLRKKSRKPLKEIDLDVEE